MSAVPTPDSRTANRALAMSTIAFTTCFAVWTRHSPSGLPLDFKIA